MAHVGLCASQWLTNMSEGHPRPAICWLDQAECRDSALVGGKAAHLSQLSTAFRVPPGFCLTTAAFDIASGMVDATTHLADKLADGVFEELTRAYATLAERCGAAGLSVAIRSSALDEDSATSSFAGQHKTFLNVVGAKAVASTVMRCWASAGSTHAQLYRIQQGLAADSIRMAVLVQQFIAADSSAVIFTANPVTGSRDELVINASWGLGESIVGGTVTPDTYVLRTSDLSIFAQQIGEKRRMTIPVLGGTREVDIPRFLRLGPVLNDNQIAELGRLGRDLEAAMGWPVDAECAYQAGHLYLLQCRPITALRSLPRA
jgi:pyruvate, water dikinase